VLPRKVRRGMLVVAAHLHQLVQIADGIMQIRADFDAFLQQNAVYA